MLRDQQSLKSVLGRPYTKRITEKRQWQVRVGSPGRIGWFLVAPALIVLLAMTVFPTLYLLRSSFFSFTLLSGESHFVGLQNYIYDLTNPDIRNSLLITLLFVVIAVGLELVIGLVLALALARQTLENNIASTLLLLPFAVTPVVSALLWRELLNPNYGWVNYYLQQIGVMRAPVAWLSSPITAWIALIGLDVWQWMPFIALILMAGLQGVPSDIKEAATVDGAAGWQQFWHITLPLLRPFIAIALLLRVLLPLLESPDYCSHQLLLASLFAPQGAGREEWLAVMQETGELLEGSQLRGTSRKELKPLYNVLSELRAKLRPFGLGIVICSSGAAYALIGLEKN